MNFTKLQGAGNDFILIEAEGIDRDWSRIAEAMCDRHYGIGGDGLLLLLPSDRSDFRMVVFNADGSEAEACGNGLRCFARYILDRGLVDSNADQITVETKAGVDKVSFQRAGNVKPAISINLGVPIFKASDIPVKIELYAGVLDIKPITDYPVTVDSDELTLSFVSMGNPHAVYFTRQPVAEFPLSRLGPKVERHRMFPNRVNFELARIISRRQIEGRIWERGVGETLASGTGASAIAVIARIHGFVDSIVDIVLPGGTLNIEWEGQGDVFLSGPAETVFSGEWPNEVK
ncbi:diaminopimelate epimerase [Chloroflexota bacterium]